MKLEIKFEQIRATSAGDINSLNLLVSTAMHLYDADGMANDTNFDQTAP